MKIQDAIREAALTGNRIGSKAAEMFSQTPQTLLYWLLGEREETDEKKVKRLRKILKADDWEIEE
jgi:hypothetical protein